MKNKILIYLYVPCIDSNYELFIPSNESVKKIIDLTVKSVNDLSDNLLPISDNYVLLDPETSYIYEYSAIIRNTNIKNSKKIILI